MILSHSALADGASYSCKRYKSKCTGEMCYQLAEGLKRDTTRKILSATTTETVLYKVNGDQATETVTARGTIQVQNADGKYDTLYERVIASPNNLIAENRTNNGQVSEKAEIDLVSGFYTYYALHNDGSIKDVPLGAPYTAYFGWCDLPAASAAPAAAPVSAPAAPAANP